MSQSIINFNNKFLPADTPLIGADSRALRYGDGIFETLLLRDGAIRHWELHLSRLFEGLHLLGIQISRATEKDQLEELILATARKNKVEKAARVRFAVFRGNGGLYDPENHHPNILIQCWPLPQHVGELNNNGLVTGIFDRARKSCDALSNIKSSSHLCYVLAALHAKQMKWNDAFVLNQHGRISDSSIANVFLITNRRIITPPLSEGCIAGVMRRYLLRELPGYGFDVGEQAITTQDLLNADECFLTNAISGIRWVGQFQNKIFTNQLSADLFAQFVSER